MGDACSRCKGTGTVWIGLPATDPVSRLQGHRRPRPEVAVRAPAPRDPERDLPCADCGQEPARLRTTAEPPRRLVCDPECEPVDIPAVLAAHVAAVRRACDPDRAR